MFGYELKTQVLTFSIILRKFSVLYNQKINSKYTCTYLIKIHLKTRIGKILNTGPLLHCRWAGVTKRLWVLYYFQDILPHQKRTSTLGEKMNRSYSEWFPSNSKRILQLSFKQSLKILTYLIYIIESPQVQIRIHDNEIWFKR